MKRSITWLLSGIGVALFAFGWFSSWYVQKFYHRTPHLFWNGVPELCFLSVVLLGFVGIYFLKREQPRSRVGANVLCGIAMVLGLYGCVALAPPQMIPPRPFSKKTAARLNCDLTLHVLRHGKEEVVKARGADSNAPITIREIITYLEPADTNFPHCLAGGVYLLNPPGSNPVCTVHGDLLKRWDELEKESNHVHQGIR